MRRRAWQIALFHSCMCITLIAILALHLSDVVAQPSYQLSNGPDQLAFKEILRIGRGSTGAVAWNSVRNIIAVGGGSGVWLYSDHFEDIAHLEVSIGTIQTLAFSPDGSMLAMGSAIDNVYNVQVWDMDTQKPIFTTANALCDGLPPLAWSPDNKLATIDGNKVMIWEPRLKADVLNIQGYKVQIVALAWSPDGKSLAGSSIDKVIQIWDVPTGNPVESFPQTEVSESIVWSPDGSLIAASGTNRIWIWDTLNKKTGGNLTGFQAIISRLIWGSNGLVSAANNDTVWLWNVGTKQVIQAFDGHTGFINDLTFSPDGSEIATASLDNTVRLWNTSSGALESTLDSHTGAIRALAWSPDGSKLASASRGSAIQVWKADGTLLMALTGHTDTVYTLAWNTNGAILASAGADGTIRTWDGNTGKALTTITGQFGDIRSIAWNSHGNTLASAGFDGTIRLWDALSGDNLLNIPVQSDSIIEGIDWSDDGKIIAATGQDGTITFWDADTGKQINHLVAHTGPVRAVTWNADNQQVLSAGDDGTLQIWDALGGHRDLMIAAHPDTIDAAAWRPVQPGQDQHPQIASVGADGSLRLWNASTGDPDATISISRTAALAWSPDGSRLAAGGDDAVIKIFALTSHAPKDITPMTVKQYRCVIAVLTIRTEPKQGDQYKTGQQLKFGDVIDVDESSRTEADGIVWIRHSRGWSAERSIDGKSVYLIDTALRPKDRQWGINIDPANQFGNPPASRLAGLGWVRFVFHYQSQYPSLDKAFAFYDPIIKAYQTTGTHVLLVLLQDTYSGNHPWTNNSGWDVYTTGFAQTAAAIATHYKGIVSAYEIWNEGDVPAALQSVQTSIYFPPDKYGPFLLATSQAIKTADPLAKVVVGGLSSGNGVDYLNAVAASINPSGGKALPVDAIAIHPYGQTPPDGSPFVGWSQGSLGDAITKMTDAYPLIPVWITEIGVPRVDVSNQQFWPGIANYMNKTFQLIRDDYFNLVPVIIWFAWVDDMDNAGVVTNGQQPKGAIFDAFMSNLHMDQPAYTKPAAATPYDGKIMLSHVSGAMVGETNIADLARNIHNAAPNVNAVLVRSSVGASWNAPFDNKPALAISNPSDLTRWATELARYRIDLHVWHMVRGDVAYDQEVAIMTGAATAPGVISIILDLDPTALQIRTSDKIRGLMLALRNVHKGHVGASFDGRPEQFGAVALQEWYPFINSWHPKIFHWQYSNATLGPDGYLANALSALKPYPKPIIPMLDAEPFAGKPVPPDQIRRGADLAFGADGLAGVSFWRLGAIGPAEFSAILGVHVPWLAGLIPAPVPPNTLIVQTSAPLRIRSTPDLNGAIVGQLQPGERITVVKQQVSGTILWVQYDRGWSVARNSATGEIYLA